MSQNLQERITSALTRVLNPRTGSSVLAAEMVRDVALTTDGKVRLTLLLSPQDDATLVRQVRQAVEAVSGVTDVRVDVKDATERAKQGAVPPPGSAGPGQGRALPVMEAPRVVNDRIIPLDAHGVKVMSIGFIIERDQPAIWRGPIVMKILTQFLRDVQWGELDYFLVDMPPGTGDAQLSLVQATLVHGAIIVTTPQEVAVGDALRGAKMFQRVGVPVLGIVENMSWFECPHCGKPTALFGSGGGERLARELALPLLGQIPLAPRVMEGGDTGAPVVLADARSAAAQALVKVADAVVEAMAQHGAAASAP